MKKLISCCGLNCAGCEARIATMKNDNNLRQVTADKWKVMFNSPDITASMINCTGCQEEGAKFAHCFECEIRKCVRAKGYDTCADCDKLADCKIVAPIHAAVPEALVNLRNLN